MVRIATKLIKLVNSNIVNQHTKCGEFTLEVMKWSQKLYFSLKYSKIALNTPVHIFIYESLLHIEIWNTVKP